MLPAVVHGPSREQTVLPLSTRQHHQRSDAHTGKRELLKHQFGNSDAGPEESQAALLPQCSTREGVCGEVSRLFAQQFPQLTPLLAAPLPQQRQRQHMSGEQLLYPVQLLEGDCVGSAGP